MIILHNYKSELQKSNCHDVVINIKNNEASMCPDCNVLCSGYDTRLRRVIKSDSKRITYRLRRVLCPSCDSLHLELPDFIRPYKQYSGDVIDDAVNDMGNDCPAENSTIWRWKKNYPPTLQ